MLTVQMATDYPAANSTAGLHTPLAETGMKGNPASEAYGQPKRTRLKTGGAFFSAVAQTAVLSDGQPAMPLTEEHSGGFFVDRYTSLALHSFVKLIESRLSIDIDNLKVVHSCVIINVNNTSQAYGQRKLATLKPGGFFFLGAE